MAADLEPPLGLPFPTDPQEFDCDERISFSRLDNKFIGVLDDGSEFEWDAQLKRWIPGIDEELLAQQQSAYGGNDGGGSDDNGPGGHAKKKRKNGSAEQHSNKRQRAPPPPRQNTAVYVTGLPLDATVDEVHEVFSRKCGVIAEEIDSGRPRIKLYADEKGNLQGDALVVFFKPQSVEMAIMLLDDTDFRYTASGLSSGRMRVQAAESKYKKTNYDQEGKGEAGSSGNGGGEQSTHNHITGTGKPKDKAREQDKQKVIKRTQKLDAKLADWDDDDSPFGTQLETNAPKGRVVILHHMFTLRELEEDPAAMLEIKEDIREECTKLGIVTNVILYDLEEEGVASVKFKTPEAAASCVNLMDGRAFDGRTVRAVIASGKEKYRRSDKDHGADDED
ncbi:putative splicing factor U2AF-associated protein 2 [Rosellinia necatrix]|uniref:Putative splicing factor U2AF-associated protein 2 n=1 Tax=Rosellinia necatrix TaxID=77044 RepID=A0A1W2TDQ6_ROSNE|nr:putative splicing factor U2AF-associated protein 2 [Rosellinia necatrix]